MEELYRLSDEGSDLVEVASEARTILRTLGDTPPSLEFQILRRTSHHYWHPYPKELHVAGA
jgi:hypothetical protein